MSISLVGVSKVIYIGDSLTAGMFSETEATCWRALTDAYLGTQGIAAGEAIFGSTGGTSTDALTRLSDMTAAAADLCFIELGTNDAGGAVPGSVSAATFQSNMTAIINAVKAGNPSCVFVFMTTWREGTYGDVMDEVIRALAAVNGDHLIELSGIYDDPLSYTPTGQPTWFASSGYPTNDGWHPNERGHRGIFNAVRCLFEDDLILLTSPYGTDEWYSAYGDIMYVTWAAGATYSASGEFGLWVIDPAGEWYLGAVEAADGQPCYSQPIWTSTINAASGAHAASGQAYYYKIGWRATVGEGGFGSFTDFTSDTFMLTDYGIIEIIEPRADNYVLLGGTANVQWDWGAQVETGDFAIWAVDVESGGYYIGDIIPADGRQVYDYQVTMAGDGIVGGGTYAIAIAYRDEGAGMNWRHFRTSDHTYTIGVAPCLHTNLGSRPDWIDDRRGGHSIPGLYCLDCGRWASIRNGVVTVGREP